MMRKLLLVSLLIASASFPGQILAQSSNEIETQKRLLEIEKKASQSATNSSKIQKTTSLTFIEGLVTSTTNKVLLLQTDFGQKTIYSVDSTRYIDLSSTGKKLIGYGDIKIGTTIFLLGLSQAASSGVAKVVVRDTVSKASTFSLFGKMSEKTDTSLTLLDHGRVDLPAIKVSIDQNTQINSSGKKSDLSTLSENDKLVLVGTIDDKGALLAKEIRKL